MRGENLIYKLLVECTADRNIGSDLQKLVFKKYWSKGIVASYLSAEDLYDITGLNMDKIKRMLANLSKKGVVYIDDNKIFITGYYEGFVAENGMPYKKTTYLSGNIEIE